MSLSKLTRMFMSSSIALRPGSKIRVTKNVYPFCSPSLSIAMRPSSSYNRGVPFIEPTLNEMPVPEGSWDADYKKKERRYNRHLFIGGTFFVFTWFVVLTSGIVQFNATIPKLLDEDMTTGACVPPPPKCPEPKPEKVQGKTCEPKNCEPKKCD